MAKKKTQGQSYMLRDAQKLYKERPKTFRVPSKKELASIKRGSFVKAAFIPKGQESGERMWVKVDDVDGNSIRGKLANTPVLIPGLKYGSDISLEKKHVHDIRGPGLFLNPKASRYQRGDVVRYTANFLRSSGQIAGTPLNGYVDGFSELTTGKGEPYPEVRWSDRDETVPVHPGNIEPDPRWKPTTKERYMSKRLPNPYRNIEEIMRANKERGHYWFSPETMEAHNSKVYPKLYGGRYFITRERMDDRFPWDFRVRVAMDDGSIETFGDVMKPYSSFDDAERIAKSAATEKNPTEFTTMRNKAPLLSLDAQGHVCGLPGALTSRERYELPTWAFALPGKGPRSMRRYPLYTVDKGRVVPSKTHAVNAKGRAKQGLDRGELTKSQYDQIVRAANKVIRLCKDQKTRKNAGKPVRLATGYRNERRLNFPDVRLGYDPDYRFESVRGDDQIQVAFLGDEAVGWVARADIPVAKRHYPDATSRAAAVLGSRSHGGKRKSKKASEAGRLMGRVGQAELRKKLMR